MPGAVATLIAVYDSSGLVGRCDAKCYLAEQDECDCICGGANHGAGYQRACDQTREMAESWIDRARAAGIDVADVELAFEATTQPLF